MKRTHIVVSYPRSGSHYFQLAWKQKNKKHIQCVRSHKEIQNTLFDNTIIIGLIRDPIEAISSRILITQTHEKFFDTVENATEFAISEYINIYKFIVDRSDFIIDLSDFKKIDKLIDCISDSGSTLIDEDKIVSAINRIPKYSPTFLDHEDYDITVNSLKDYDLSHCYSIYKDAYSKRLVV